LILARQILKTRLTRFDLGGKKPLDDDFAHENFVLVLGIKHGLTLSINFADKFLEFSFLEIVSKLLKI
jgi:hypothetical protein